MVGRPTAYDILLILTFLVSLAYGLVYLSLPWFPIALESLVATLLFLYYILSKKPSKDGLQTKRIYRKTFHIIGGLFLTFFVMFYSPFLVVYLVLSLLSIALLYEALRWCILRKPIWLSEGLQFFGVPEELRGGPFYEAFLGLAGVLITVSFFNKEAAICGLLTLSVGDGMSGLVGERIKTPILPLSRQKTVGGLFAGLFASSIMTMLVLGDLKALIGVLLGMSVEVFSQDLDNLLVPVSSALAYTVLLAI